jgi:hypothetical protein
MKNILLFIAFMSIASSAVAQKKTKPQSINYVIINSVKWATCNVATPETFTKKPENPGMFYQWNSKKAWPLYGAVKGWNSSWNGGFSITTAYDKWKNSSDPSPVGYRIPNYKEVESLIDTSKVFNEWINQNGINGTKFTDRKNGNSIFLPAAGNRIELEGWPILFNEGGYYWINEVLEPSNAFGLMLTNVNIAGFLPSISRGQGCNIRPVLK